MDQAVLFKSMHNYLIVNSNANIHAAASLWLQPVVINTSRKDISWKNYMEMEEY
jgi:hypothetical protein